MRIMLKKGRTITRKNKILGSIYYIMNMKKVNAA